MPPADIILDTALTDRWGVGTSHDGTTEATAYLISDTAGLNLLARYVNGTDGYAANDFSGKYFSLNNNITYSYAGLDPTESNYTAIGTDSHPFRGTFDGANDTISGIRIYKGGSTDADSYQGLFGKVAGGTVKDVTLSDAVVTGHQNVGGIVGQLTGSGSVEDCHATASVVVHAVVSLAAGHGGIAGGVNGGSLSGCSSAATLTVDAGLWDCIAYGAITGALSGSMEDCLALGATVGGTGRVGALVGYKTNGNTFARNYYRGCTVGGTEGATGVGVGGEAGSDNPHDRDGARSLHTLTLGDGITPSNASETKTIGSTTYYASASSVLLSCELPTGYSFDGYVIHSSNNSSNQAIPQSRNNPIMTYTFTPAEDVTVDTALTDRWGVTATPAADGTAEHPYVISDAEGLDLLARCVNLTEGYPNSTFSGLHFELWADIEYDTTNLVQGNNYTAIGTNYNPFRGIFDGKGHTVSNLRIDKGGTDYQGLFGQVYEGTVDNVVVNNARIFGYYNVGAIVGYISQGTLEHCLALGSVMNGTGSVGAVAGSFMNATFDHNYYHHCKAKDATSDIGIGNISGCYDVSEGDAAVEVHILTLEGPVTATPDAVRTYQGDAYYKAETPVPLVAADEGYAVNAATISTLNSQPSTLTPSAGLYSFAMPAEDATVTATVEDVWGVTATPAADGSAAHPYVITSRAGLDLLSQRVNLGHAYADTLFLLGNDISYTHSTDWDDASSTENNYTTIGWTKNYIGTSFAGIFDGQGYTVSGIRIYRGGDNNADNYQGLFGIVIGGTVKNVTLADSRITGRSNVGGIAGALVTEGPTAHIENCHAAATVALHAVQDNAVNHGGVVGALVSGSTVGGCTSAATLSYASGLTGCTKYGGIVGYLNGGLQNCLVLGATVSGTDMVGAVAGYTSISNLSQNYYHGCTVSGQADAMPAYTIAPGPAVTLAASATSTSSYPYGGIQVYPGLLAYGGALYTPTGDTTLTLSLGYTGTSARHYGYEASTGTLVNSSNQYSLTLDDADVVVDAITCEHGNSAPSFDLDDISVCVNSDGDFAATVEALALGEGNNIADDYTPVDELTITQTFDAEPYDPTTHPDGYLVSSEGYRRYYCTWTVTDDCGLQTEQSNQITVYSPPLITITDSLQTVTYGETIDTMHIGVDYESTFTVTGSAEGLTYDAEEHTLSGTPTVAGTYDFTVTATSLWSLCPATTAPITVTVNQRPLTVIATTAAKPYDGSALTDGNWQLSDESSLALSDVIASINITGSQTLVGSTSNTPSGAVITDGGSPAVDRSANYDITYQPGTLTVTPNTSVIKVIPGSGTKVYDGTPLTKNELRDFTVTGVPDGFTWSATANGTVTNVIPGDFDYDNEVNAVSSFVIYDAAGEDVTNCFSNIDISATGTLTVTPREATVRACVAYKPYDGTPLKCTECTYSGIVEGDTVRALSSGKQTAIGTSVNVLIDVYVFNSDEDYITDNYHIIKVNGSLTVTPRVDISEGSWHVVSTPMHDEGNDYWIFGDALTRPAATDGPYDLFRYDEPTSTWENYKEGGFDQMDLCRGYLYRSTETFALPYTGLFNNEASYGIALTADGAGDLRGFNLVGNPYPYKVKLDRAFYSLNADGSWTAHLQGDSIAAGQGALVYASAPETLTFYAATRSTNPGKKGSLPSLPGDLNLDDVINDDINVNLNDDFARWEGDQIVVTGTGILQAYDIMGREIFRKENKSEEFRMKNSEFPQAGVYVLKLNGNSQKIVIKRY